MQPGTAPAALPPPDLHGLDPAWSRLITCSDHTGTPRTWHLLDNHAEQRHPTAAADRPRLTLLCVHGNPSWSYLWRRLLADAPADVRVIAVDQLDMGFSERTGVLRRLADRVDDLVALTDHLELSGPVITVAHDWGGPIALGWAQRHLHQAHKPANHKQADHKPADHKKADHKPAEVAGVVLGNTAVHQPEGSPAPALIRLTRTPGALRQITVTTTAFIHGAIKMSRPALDPRVVTGLLAPYRSAQRRHAIADFVEDIPLDDSHPSASALDAIAAGLADLADTPALLLWGPRDPIFSDLYLHDLETRLPHADVHRFVGASHFVSEDADVAGAIFTWLDRQAAAGSSTPASNPASTPARAPLWAALVDRRESPRDAVVELTGDHPTRISFGDLHDRVMRLAAGLHDDGIQPGDRVALMIPPGIDLTVALYAIWRMGAVAVLVDGGLSPSMMGRALASANPKHLIGIPKALAAARALRWPGRRIDARDLEGLERPGPAPEPPADDDLAAVVFTSGSTGPSKGVTYRHRQLQAQRDQLAALYEITDDDRLVAAFAPFALYGAALGITSAVPRGDVAKPASLTAAALAEAAGAISATLVFASPAPIDNVAATAAALTPTDRASLDLVRLVLSAGAPVSDATLAAAEQILPQAEAHTPYGMTEVLPVADISLSERQHRTGGDGVCVGRPRHGVEVQIAPLDPFGEPSDTLTASPGVVGEIVVRADHAMAGYDRLWYTQAKAARPPGWHRSGDVGHLDADGFLWVGGRLEHLLRCGDGPRTPVGIEHRTESVDGIRRAAAVGIGPVGAQVCAVVVETTSGRRRPRLAPVALADAVRAANPQIDIAALLEVRRLPVDRRHNSKVDRTRVAAWASKVLAGDRVPRL